MRKNALWNCKNPNQGKYEKVLCVCSAGLLRSPTIAEELIKIGYNARSAGVHDYALIQVDEVLLEWADKIVFAGYDHYKYCAAEWDMERYTCLVLDIPDEYEFRNPELVGIIKQKLKENGFV